MLRADHVVTVVAALALGIAAGAAGAKEWTTVRIATEGA